MQSARLRATNITYLTLLHVVTEIKTKNTSYYASTMQSSPHSCHFLTSLYLRTKIQTEQNSNSSTAPRNWLLNFLPHNPIHHIMQDVYTISVMSKAMLLHSQSNCRLNFIKYYKDIVEPQPPGPQGLVQACSGKAFTTKISRLAKGCEVNRKGD